MSQDTKDAPDTTADPRGRILRLYDALRADLDDHGLQGIIDPAWLRAHRVMPDELAPLAATLTARLVYADDAVNQLIEQARRLNHANQPAPNPTPPRRGRHAGGGEDL